MNFDRLSKPTDPWLFELWKKYQDLAFLQSLSESDSHPMVQIYTTVLIENCVSGILDYCKPKQEREVPKGINVLREKHPYYTAAYSSIPPILEDRVQELLDLKKQEEEKQKEIKISEMKFRQRRNPTVKDVDEENDVLF